MILLLLAACTADVDSAVVDTACESAPSTSWDNFGVDFTRQHCQSCHASTSGSRQGAPESVTFDDEDAFWTHSDRALERVLAGEMPPQDGVTPDEKTRLELWLTCD